MVVLSRSFVVERATKNLLATLRRVDGLCKVLASIKAFRAGGAEWTTGFDVRTGHLANVECQDAELQ